MHQNSHNGVFIKNPLAKQKVILYFLNENPSALYTIDTGL